MVRISSSEVRCHPSNISSFSRDQLKERILTTINNRSAYVIESDASRVIYITKLLKLNRIH
jgi:hypothetical protein